LPTSSGRVICASSSGDYWQGVPVLVQGEAFQVYGNIPVGLKAEIHGVWSPMPREHAQGLGGDAGIPRYCLVVSHGGEINPLEEVRYGLSSAWTLCEHREPDSRLKYSFIFCTFDTKRQTSLLRTTNEGFYSTGDAVGFIKEYIDKIRGQALTDFDEEIPNFDSQLPVAEMMSRRIDSGRLRTFVDRIKKQALSPETVRYEIIPQMLMGNFSIEELRALAFDFLALDLTHLVGPSAGKADQVDRLIEYCEQQDRLEDLAAGIIQERPQLQDKLATRKSIPSTRVKP
jgi:hypothetical protein